jgi:RNA polymerase sigma factor (sigma-70 family)
MSDGDQDFEDLIKRFNDGDPDAAEELIDRYEPDVRRVIRHRLHTRLRRQFDSVDFLQSVWVTFFAIPADQLEFANPAGLRHFLLELATNKVIDAFRRRMQSRRFNTSREKSLSDSTKFEANDVAAATATPSQTLMAEEAWNGLIEGLPAISQTILSMLREGRTHSEIARTLSVSERTIARLLHKIQPRRVP